LDDDVTTAHRLSDSSIKSLSQKLYQLRKQKRTRVEMEHTSRLAVAVEQVYSASCESDMMAGVCAELSLQLCALYRETHLYVSAVTFCENGVKMAKIASLQQSKAWKHGDEFAALRMRGKAALARAYGDMFEYDKALGVMKDIHDAFGVDIPSAARWVLMDLHSEILMCAGEVHMSLVVYENSHGKSQKARSISDLRRHIELLDASLNSRPPPPMDVVRAMRERRKQTVVMLLSVGSWDSIHQLPQHYFPGLSKLGPFPSWNSMNEHFHLLRKILKSFSKKLTTEIQQLISLGMNEEQAAVLVRDRECVHGKISSTKVGGGRWLRYSPTGYWHGDSLGDVGCTTDTTPVACELHATLQRDLPPGIILRVGYSVVSENTWIRPHYGRTNKQLKLHLGLVVPDRNGGIYKCPAELRVANEVREWGKGDVMLFDDSFEHEVYNGCDTSRAVLQLVVQRR